MALKESVKKSVKKSYEINISIQYEDTERDRDKDSPFETWPDSSICRIIKGSNGEVHVDALKPNLSLQHLDEVSNEMIEFLAEAEKTLKGKVFMMLKGIVMADQMEQAALERKENAEKE